MVAKEAVGQVHFDVTKYSRADYIALNLHYSTGSVSFVIIWVTESNHILSHSLLAIPKIGTGILDVLDRAFVPCST